MQEFSTKGYAASSLNTICAENGISKGIIYHYFEDKDELYSLCVADCFESLSAYLKERLGDMSGSVEQQLQKYFDVRLRFFSENPKYLGIFTGAALDPPDHLTDKIAQARRDFDELNISVLTRLLESTTLRNGMTVTAVVDDFRMYMDYFNLRFKDALAGIHSAEQALQLHEERCHRQLNILLYGVMGEEDENRS